MQQSRHRPAPPPRAPRRRAAARGTLGFRGHGYDVIAAGTRVGVGWMFTEYGLALRGREGPLAEGLLGSKPPLIAFVAPVVLPALIVALSISFAVGLLTWTAGPLLALAAIVATVTTGAEHPPPFDSWGATSLVTVVCLLMAVAGGRWSWDYLILGIGAPISPRRGRRATSAARGKVPTISRRRPEHAPPLLYPVGQAALRRPYRL